MKIEDDILKKNEGKIHCILSPAGYVNHRALVIQSVCEIESDLCSIIGDFFVSRNNEIEKEKVLSDLYSENGMLGSLFRIAKIAFYLGLINKELHHDLNKLAKLRNRYAHDKNRGQLEQEPDLYKFMTDTYLFRQNRARFNEFVPLGVFMSIQEQISRQIQQIDISA